MTDPEPPVPADADPAPSAAGGPPTCYRHPDREAHIRCARCDRRICPDCMVSASVGFQCPECVREGRAGQRVARTHFGGRVSTDTGYVTRVLIGINVVVFLLQQVSSSFENRFILFGAFPVGAPVEGVAAGEYYRLVTAAFMHAGLLHILLNMYALYLFGPPVEAALGRVRFLTLYLVAAVGGTAASYAFSAPTQPSLGASGAIFGLLGAFFVINRKLGRETTGIVVLIAINVALGFWASNIDWRAHLGGMVSGALVAVVMAYAPQRHRVLVQAAGVVVVLAAIVALVVWRTAQLTG